jgi:FMN-dependent NADH-azoreductase
MSTLLSIVASPRGDYSVSRNLTKQFVAEWQKNHPGNTVVNRDLATTQIPFVDLPWIAGAFSAPDTHTPEHKAALKISDEFIAELFAAEHIVIGTPMYNFNVPAVLKAWIDHIVRFGVTFNASYEGLLKNKKVTLIIASGGVYTPGAQMEAYNFESGYLKHILGFVGLTDINVVLAGGTNDVNQGKVPFEEFIASHQAAVLEAAK